jgi:hypothetical protein
MRRRFTVAAALVAAACHHAPRSELELTASESVQGTYEYAATIQGRQVRGVFTLGGDDVAFTTRGAACQNLTRAGSPDILTLARYGCRGIGEFRQVDFYISLRSPVTQSKWQTTYLERKSRQVCDKVGPGRDGREVCRASHLEYYDVEVPIGGPLVVRRSEAVAIP